MLYLFLTLQWARILIVCILWVSRKSYATFYATAHCCSGTSSCLTGPRPEMVLLTEVSIAGGKSRSTPASTLKDAWVRTAADLGVDTMDLGIIDEEKSLHSLVSSHSRTNSESIMLAACPNLSVCDSIKFADRLLKSRERGKPGLIVVTGSLHIVSSVLADISCYAP